MLFFITDGLDAQINCDCNDNINKSVKKTYKSARKENTTKSWYCYGNELIKLYNICNKEEIPKFCKKHPDILERAGDAFLKAWIRNFKNEDARKLDIPNEKTNVLFKKYMKCDSSEYLNSIAQKSLMSQISKLVNLYVNKGFEAYKEQKDYETALSYFERGLFYADILSEGQFYSNFTNRIIYDTELIYYTVLD